MSDLVTKLRAAAGDERLSTGQLYTDAADEIERLRGIARCKHDYLVTHCSICWQSKEAG